MLRTIRRVARPHRPAPARLLRAVPRLDPVDRPRRQGFGPPTGVQLAVHLHGQLRVLPEHAPLLLRRLRDLL